MKILYVETKEFGPLGGVPGARPLDPPMQTGRHIDTTKTLPDCIRDRKYHVFLYDKR